jgi:hypothetical protein
VFFCRLDSLREDLVAFFERIGVATRELRDYVLGLDKQNTSEHGHESTYYTTELAELVRIRDRELVERFGFTFEGRNSKCNAAWLLDESREASLNQSGKALSQSSIVDELRSD